MNAAANAALGRDGRGATGLHRDTFDRVPTRFARADMDVDVGDRTAHQV